MGSRSTRAEPQRPEEAGTGEGQEQALQEHSILGYRPGIGREGRERGPMEGVQWGSDMTGLDLYRTEVLGT